MAYSNIYQSTPEPENTHFLDKQMPCQAPLYTQPEEPKECLERVAAD